MEDFASAVGIYEDLKKRRGQIDNEAQDIASNLSASKAQIAVLTGIGSEDASDASDGYEIQFNLACQFIAIGKLSEAEKALNKAESNILFAKEANLRIMQQS